MRLNMKRLFARTHEGGPAVHTLTPLQQLRRSVLSCMLWESEFYEDGQEIAERIRDLGAQVTPQQLAALAVEARTEMHLRHAPLVLLSVLARTGSGSRLVSDTIADTIRRADELAEFLAVHAALNGVTPDKVKSKLSAQMKKGLARALGRFDAYQLAKYDREGPVRLRDVLFLVHAKPADEDRAALYARLAANELESPDTWEVALSGGADKAETFTRLLTERKLGYLALLRNLRGMVEAGVDTGLIRDAIIARRGGAERVLPFRYVAAARACPQLEPAIDQALSEAIAELAPLKGRTLVLVDVSGSMGARLSRKSDLSRADAAAALASIVHGEVRLFSFSDRLVEVPPRRGMAGVDAVLRSQPHCGTWLGKAVAEMNRIGGDRLIVITDEQSHDKVPDPAFGRAYMINVASARNGVGYGRWTHIDGFSENVLRWIVTYESA